MSTFWLFTILILLSFIPGINIGTIPLLIILAWHYLSKQSEQQHQQTQAVLQQQILDAQERQDNLEQLLEKDECTCNDEISRSAGYLCRLCRGE